MITLILESYDGAWSAYGKLSDDMFDENAKTISSIACNPDTAIERILSDYEIGEHQVIGRAKYDRLWEQHDCAD